MEMHQIRYFVALCHELNFTRTARRCGVAQPSLTRAIQQLEAELHGSLFHRDPTPQLTERGKAVRPLLEGILRYAEDARRRAAAFNGTSVPAQPAGDAIKYDRPERPPRSVWDERT